MNLKKISKKINI